MGMVTPGPAPEQTKVLICEDAPGYQMLLEVSLADAGMDVVASADSWDEAKAAAGRHGPDLVLVDLWLPYRDDAALLALREAAGNAVLVAISGLSTEEATAEIGVLGVIDLVLSKRQSMTELIAALQDRLAQRDGS